MPRSRLPAALPPPGRLAATIIRELEPCTASGARPDTVFEDWLVLVDAALRQLPAHYQAAVQTGQAAADPPAVQALWQRLGARYRHAHDWEHFSRAFALLLGGTATYQDVLGQMYMQWGRPRTGLGQFFTPWGVAHLLAQMTADPEQIRTRIAAAVAAAPPAQAALAAGAGLAGAAADAWLVAQVLPWVLPMIEPLRYAEPSCGSGVLILAVAAVYPRWMSQLGLLHFYAIDLDPLCTLMCRVQCRLYGLAAQVECGNGLSATLPCTAEGRILPARGSALAWAASMVAALPAPYPERAAAIDVQLAAACVVPSAAEPSGQVTDDAAHPRAAAGRAREAA